MIECEFYSKYILQADCTIIKDFHWWSTHWPSKQVVCPLRFSWRHCCSEGVVTLYCVGWVSRHEWVKEKALWWDKLYISWNIDWLPVAFRFLGSNDQLFSKLALKEIMSTVCSSLPFFRSSLVKIVYTLYKNIYSAVTTVSTPGPTTKTSWWEKNFTRWQLPDRNIEVWIQRNTLRACLQIIWLFPGSSQHPVMWSISLD